MKIVSSSKINIFMEGILFVLTKINNDCIIWNSDQKPFFNMLDEQKPDILFLSSNEEKIAQIAKEERNIKVVIIGKEKPKIPVSAWIIPSPYANTIKYNHKKEKKIEYSYNMLYFSDYPINKEQIDILKNISKTGTKLGIFGKVRLPLYEYVGIDLKSERTLLLYNCDAGIDFFGYHFLDFALFNKFCFTLFDNPLFFSVKEFKELTMNIQPMKINDPKQYIYDNKITDCHFASSIFDKLNYKEISKQCLSLLV